MADSPDSSNPSSGPSSPSESVAEFLKGQLERWYGPQDVERILQGSQGGRAVTLRANTLLSSPTEVADALDTAQIPWRKVGWYDDAFVLEHARERAIWDLQIYQDGKVYLQSLSSMIPALILDAREGEDICDMCAAPGGKTSQIAALSNGRAYITACEMHPPRAEKLEYNLEKLAVRNVTVMRTDARRLDDFFSFDRILVDAPCSGSGTLDCGNGKTARRFTPALIEKSIKSQRALLEKALSLLRPGGSVVYSTCSILPCENEEVVRWALSRLQRVGTFEVGAIEAAEGMPLLPCSLDGALTICPDQHYEGFFVAKITRTA